MTLALFGCSCLPGCLCFIWLCPFSLFSFIKEQVLRYAEWEGLQRTNRICDGAGRGDLWFHYELIKLQQASVAQFPLGARKLIPLGSIWEKVWQLMHMQHLHLNVSILEKKKKCVSQSRCAWGVVQSHLHDVTEGHFSYERGDDVV